MAKFRIATPAGASFTVAGGDYGYELEALTPIDAEFVFDTHTPPYMRLARCTEKSSRKHLAHALRPLCEYLIRVPVSRQHDICDLSDVIVWNGFMKQVAHGVHEDSSWRPPGKGDIKLIRNEPEVETLLEGVSLHSAKAFGKCLSVAVCAPSADFCATAHRVPRRIGPFDRRVLCHVRVPAVCDTC